MTYTTGNPIRDHSIKQAITEALALDEPMTVANLKPYLPAPMREGEHSVSQDEVNGFTGGDIGVVTAEFVELPAQEVRTDVLLPTAPAAPEQMASAPRRQPTAAEIAKLDDAVVAAHVNLAAARASVMSTQERSRRAKIKLSQVISAFQNGFAPLSHDDLVHQYANDCVEHRRKEKAGEVPPRIRPPTGLSVIDRMNAPRDEGGERYGRQYARSAHNKRGTYVGVPMARPKLPSER
jgi:hypothetical protein